MKEPPSKVLIIDDDEKILMGLKANLKREGYSVMTASRGENGLRQAQEKHPDLIICDVMMPPPNGFELKKMLGEDPQTAEIPFIFLTARTNYGDKVTGLQMGADDYITKPFYLDELLVRIQSVLRRGEIGRQQGINQASASQKTLERRRQDLAAMICHDLRSPLSNIVSSLNILEGMLPIGEKEQIQDLFKIADRAVVRMQRLTSSLLDINRLETDDPILDLSLIDPAQLIRDALQAVESALAARQLQLKLDVKCQDIVITADTDMLTRVLINLLENAIKFSPDQGVIAVFCKKEEANVWFWVEDNGPGIPEEIREQVFDKYVRLPNRQTTSGIGLGLAFCRLAIEAHGGRIWVENNTLLSGSNFTFTLPVHSI
jgi:two-component system, sensor histidine kinase and response regulator